MDIPQKINNPEDVNRKRPKCKRRVTLRTKAVEYDGCLNRCHKECDGFLDEDYRGTSEKVWFCKLRNARRDFELTIAGVKFFLTSVDNSVRTVKVDPKVILQSASKMQPTLQFTLETTNESGDLAF